MIIAIISTFLIVGGIVASIYLALSLHRNPPPSSEAEWLSKAQFGEFEERLQSLREVIVFADQIEVPTQENAREVLFALLDNFSEGVSYTFVVPQSYYSEHHEVVNNRYNAIRALANELSRACPSSELFQITSREKAFDEPDYPYVFYRYETTTGGSEVVAFRGEDLGVGIADHYRRLEPEIARSFLFTTLTLIHADHDKLNARKQDYTQFAETDKVIEFQNQNEKARKIARRP